jgi:hypothetical protein
VIVQEPLVFACFKDPEREFLIDHADAPAPELIEAGAEVILHALRLGGAAALRRLMMTGLGARPLPSGWPKNLPCLHCGTLRLTSSPNDRLHERCRRAVAEIADAPACCEADERENARRRCHAPGRPITPEP